MMNEGTKMTIDKADLLRLVATLEFRPFGKWDWDTFNGCNSENPMIAETETFCVIVDGEDIEMIKLDEEGCYSHTYALLSAGEFNFYGDPR